MLAALALLVLLFLGPRARAERAPASPPRIGIAVQVALESGQPVVDEAWVEAQIAAANRLFAAVPVVFYCVETRPGRGYPARLLTRRDRDAALSHLRRGVVNLRIAAALMDVDEPGRVRRGVHWHLRADPTRRAVLLSAIAGPDILAHELGHFFGNGHSAVPDNLMSYTRSGGTVALDEAQLAQTRRTLQQLLRARELLLGPRGAHAP